ncbi:MAG: type III pantothenate kinase [Planctomycetota bacterium]
MGQKAEPAALVTLDRGNTTLDVMRWGPTPQRWRLRPDDLQGLREVLHRTPAGVVGCTAVPDGLGPATAVAREFRLRLLQAGPDLPCPMPLRYREPATLGIDRWVAALAAYGLHGEAVVVDCGTAVTVDVVTSAGEFVGGAIAPGLAAMARGLAATAPSLPSPDLGIAIDGVPTTSEDAVRTGCVVGFVGAVERLVGDLERSAGLRAATYVLTGGDAPRCLALSRLSFCHEPALIHQGLRELWRRAYPDGS